MREPCTFFFFRNRVAFFAMAILFFIPSADSQTAKALFFFFPSLSPSKKKKPMKSTKRTNAATKCSTSTAAVAAAAAAITATTAATTIADKRARKRSRRKSRARHKRQGPASFQEPRQSTTSPTSGVKRRAVNVATALRKMELGMGKRPELNLFDPAVATRPVKHEGILFFPTPRRANARSRFDARTSIKKKLQPFYVCLFVY